jgi:hypothetical protein
LLRLLLTAYHRACLRRARPREIKALNSQLVKLEGWKRAERRQMRTELKQLYKEERVRQEKAVKVRARRP